MIRLQKAFLVVATLLFPMTNYGQEPNAVLDRISEKLESFRQDYPLEKVYVQTDKEIYAPGEIIWFSSTVFDRSENRPSGQSPVITANLYDAAGNFITGDKFPVTDGFVPGDLKLPAGLPLGRYYLAAFTPLQVSPENVFIKPLVVDRYYESDAMITFVNPEKIHTAGTKSVIEMNISDFSGNPVDKFQMNYEIRHGNTLISEGKVRSDKGKAVIEALMPAKTGITPVELLVSHPKNLWVRKLPLKTSGDEIVLKFYAEGGHVVGTVAQKMGFYATAWNSVPVELEADVINPAGEVISKARTFAPGFGLFPYKGVAGQKHKLVITSEYGKGQQFELPETTPGQVVITVSKTDDEFITADLLVGQPGTRNLAVTATKGTQLRWAASIAVASTARIRIPVADLGTGVIQLAVFNDSGDLQSARLVYIPGKKRLEVRVTAETPADDKVKLTVTTLDENKQPVDARVILSLADEKRRMGMTNTVNPFLSLNGDLKNPVVETSGESGKSVLTGIALDYLMICNELKCFSWEKILAEEKPGGAPVNNMGVTGKVTDKKGTPVPGAKVSIMNTREMQMYSATAGPDGQFSFATLQPVDIADFNISATGVDGKGNLQVLLDPSFPEKVGMKVKNLDSRYAAVTAPRKNMEVYLSANPGLLMAQPVVKPIAAGSSGKRENYKTLLQTSTSLLEVIKSMRPYTLMSGQIVFPGTINSINAQSGALIVIDGQKMGTQADILNSITPYDVEKINISLDPIDIQKYTGLNNVGVIEITTKRGEMAESPEAVSPKEELYLYGYRIPRNFLTTDALENVSGKDMRTTLFWDSGVKTGSTGSTTFSVPLSEIKSGFVIRAEAITLTGETGEGEATFKAQ